MDFAYRRVRRWYWPAFPAALLCSFIALPHFGLALEPHPKALATAYQSEATPLLERYCHDCHGTDLAEGDIDLASMASWEAAVKHPRTWQKVAEMLSNGLMPPEDAEQPTVAEREKLQRWVRDYLTLEAQARAGDPGRVVLRRLSNVEYTFTLRDLTGVESLDPAREFPVDGAAGEGFTNTGNSLVMSPALVTKYLDAAKEVAAHAVLLPDGFRFSPFTSQRDRTDDLIAQIRQFYGQFSEGGGGTQVNLQGVVFHTNDGGRLPIGKYLTASIFDRDKLTSGKKTIDEVAREHHLHAKYLGILWSNLTSSKPSLLLDDLRARWRAAKPEDVPKLIADIEAWQESLWAFSSVGLIGRAGGPKQWMAPIDPLATVQEIKLAIPESPDGKIVKISLVAADAGDGNEQDYVLWKSPRLVSPGHPDLLLRDVRRVAHELELERARLFASAAAALQAVDDAAASDKPRDIAALSLQYGIDEASLRAWFSYLGVGPDNAVQLEGLFVNKLNAVAYPFVNGWGSNDTPSLIANSSDEQVRIPGTMKPHSVAVHPSPSLRSAVGWRSPISASMKIEASVTHAHPECGNGVTWALEVRRGFARQRLAEGRAQGPNEIKIGPVENVYIRSGDMISLSIGPRDGHHGCDLTAIDLVLSAEAGGKSQTWNLAQDISADVQAGNPHADQFGNVDVWYFYSEPDGDHAVGPIVPADSLLAKWFAATDPAQRRKLALELQKLLTNGPANADSPDSALYRQLALLRGPLLAKSQTRTTPSKRKESIESDIGLDPSLFGRHPGGGSRDAADLCVQAPSVVEIRLPADLVAGCEFLTTGRLDPETGSEGTVQLVVTTDKAAVPTELLRGEVKQSIAKDNWLATNQVAANSTPILVTTDSAAQRRVESAFAEYRELFPPALCYSKIVPVDEALSLILFYREDDHLVRLMLDDAQAKELDRLWSELRFVSRDALALVDAYAQLMEYATQDADPKEFEPMRKPIMDGASAFQQQLVDAEPHQLASLIDFAAQAYRRPLVDKESRDLQSLYDRLRAEKLSHEEAFRLTLARVLVAPAFLYRIEQPVPGKSQGLVSHWEIASRLSYFLWASQPDKELRELAASGRLNEPDVLVAQARRMLRDARARRLATQFACHWLHIDDFENHDEKSERQFPTFIALRDDMAEESILFFTDLFQNDGTILDILNADYTFLNEELAQHYGIPHVIGPEWRRVEGVKQFSRGGVLAQAATLAKQSGASRTSPILRGNWISEALLGERLPNPPKGVPPLPDDEPVIDKLTVRQLVEKHTADPKCAGCHRRIDPYGFALESFDAIGRLRTTDLGNRSIDTQVKALDGAEFEGLEGLREYILTTRRDSFVRQFCRKLLGYSLGRAAQLSDEPLLNDMQQELAARDYKVSTVVEMIVKSPQFREIRGMDAAFEE